MINVLIIIINRRHLWSTKTVLRLVCFLITKLGIMINTIKTNTKINITMIVISMVIAGAGLARAAEEVWGRAESKNPGEFEQTNLGELKHWLIIIGSNAAIQVRLTKLNHHEPQYGYIWINNADNESSPGGLTAFSQFF